MSELKYLFISEHEDGTIIEQAPDDRSAMYAGLAPHEIAVLHCERFPDTVAEMNVRRKAGTLNEEDYQAELSRTWKSQFYDVCNHSLPVVRFSLVGDGHCRTIDLTNGNFIVDGVAQRLHNNTDLPFKSIELVFFRQHQHHRTTNVKVLADGNLQETSEPVLTVSPITYRMGFKATKLDGSTFERIMEFE